MAISPKMLAVVQKVAAAEAVYFAKLRTKAAQDRLRIAKAKLLAAKRTPPTKTSSPRAI